MPGPTTGAQTASAQTARSDVLDLAALTPVGLDELTERASLQTRVDRKYLLPLADAAALVGELRSTVRVLQIDAVRTFGYESVYFDTPDLACFRLAAHKRPIRYKVRTRTYLDSGQCWLEVKTRDRRGRTVKQRLAYDTRDRDVLTGEGTQFVRDALAGTVPSGGEPAGLRPTLVTRYRRTTLLVPADDSRLTIDTDLVCLTDEDRALHLPARAVVETKTTGHASDVDRLLWRRGHRPVQVSKYGTGLAALHPGLPGAKWRPVLRHHPFVPHVADAPLPVAG
jgi:hypothetical protein